MIAKRFHVIFTSQECVLDALYLGHRDGFSRFALRSCGPAEETNFPAKLKATWSTPSLWPVGDQLSLCNFFPSLICVPR